MSSINQRNIALNDEDQFMFAMDLVSSKTIGEILTTALELDLLEILSKAGSGNHLSCSEIASQLPTKNPNAPEILDRMLRFLASYSIIACKIVAGDGDDLPQRLYGLSPASKYLVRNEDGFCLGTMMLSQHKFGFSHWNTLKDAILGETSSLPFEIKYGKTFFETMTENEEMYKSFSQDMTHYTAILTKKILQVYQGFDGLKVLVDIGGGLGINLSLIVSKYPTIKGINFDVPHVIKNAPPMSGVEHIGGDMFSYIPKGDAIFMKWILHDWSDEECVKVLKKCYESLPETGKVIIVESLVPEFPENNIQSKLVLQMDMFMLCGPGARERTMTEFEVLARAAGFKTVKPVCCVCTLWVIELYKKCAI